MQEEYNENKKQNNTAHVKWKGVSLANMIHHINTTQQLNEKSILQIFFNSKKNRYNHKQCQWYQEPEMRA